MKRKVREAEKSPSLIDSIEVEGLFQTYSYKLKAASTEGPASGHLVLLYGNNGTGKTTLLNLLYHLMHPEPYAGHRSYVGAISFKAFRLFLADGTAIHVSRTAADIRGPYRVHVERPNRPNIDWTWAEETKRGMEEPEYREYCSFLQELGITFHYLRDTRRVEGRKERRQLRLRHQILYSEEGPAADESFEDQEEETVTPGLFLRQSIEAATRWFGRQALSGTSMGYTSVNSIYRDIIRRVVTGALSPHSVTRSSVEKLIEDLVLLKKRNSAFAKFGLTPEMDITDIITYLQRALPQHLEILNTVLGPYLEGHQARLDALQSVQEVMNDFVSLLTDFYAPHKTVTIHLARGLEIKADTGQILQPNLLSSGEKQLLLLFCNAISARGEKTIFMIDEPEISLNVKWQRQLIPALLTCMSGTEFQLVLATHSIELLAQYRAYVTPLDNILEEGQK